MKNIWIAASLASLLALAPGASAQQKPIRVLVTLAAGGSLDATTRLFAERLHESLGQPVIVENRAGASGRIAMEALKAAPADGSVLMASASGSITLLPNTFKTPPFDPNRDFAPVAQMAEVAFALTVNAGVPARTASEFAALAKADPAFRSIGSTPRSNTNLLAWGFARAADVPVVHVPYKGNGQAILDLIGGRISGAFLAIGEALQQRGSGKLRVLATTGARRSSLMPDMPTLKESGYDVEGSAWFALFAPAGTPPATVERLSRAVVEAAASPELRERLAHAGVETAPLSSKELAAKIRAEYQDIGRALRASGFQPD